MILNSQITNTLTMMILVISMLTDGNLNGTWTLIFRLLKHLMFGFQGKLAKLTSADTLELITHCIGHAMEEKTMEHIATNSRWIAETKTHGQKPHLMITQSL